MQRFTNKVISEECFDSFACEESMHWVGKVPYSTAAFKYPSSRSGKLSEQWLDSTPAYIA